RISRPASDIGSSAGSAGTTGATISESAMPRPTLTCTGTARLPNMGATAIRPSTRVSGQMKAAIQVLSWALVMVIMGVMAGRRMHGCGTWGASGVVALNDGVYAILAYI